MRLFFVALVIVTVVFLGIMGFGGGGDEPAGNDQARGFHPPALLGAIGKLAFHYPGATYVLPGTPFQARLGMPAVVAVAPGSGTRLVRLELVAGALARVSYDCAGHCAQPLCLIAAAAPKPPDCGDDASETGGFVLDSAGGQIRIEATDLRPVRVVSR